MDTIVSLELATRLVPLHQNSTNLSSDRTVTDAKSAVLSLSTELRVKIFEMVIEARGRHVAGCEDGDGVRLQECYVYGWERTVDVAEQCLGKQCIDNYGKSLPATNLALLLVCRTFHEDAAELKWQNHAFQVNVRPGDTFVAFVARLSQRQRKAIKTLYVNLPEWHSDDDNVGSKEDPLKGIEELNGLRCLIVNLRSKIRQMPRIDLRGRTGLQLKPLRLLDLDLTNVRIFVSSNPPARIPELMRMPGVVVDYSGLWRKSLAFPLRTTDEVLQHS